MRFFTWASKAAVIFAVDILTSTHSRFVRRPGAAAAAGGVCKYAWIEEEEEEQEKLKQQEYTLCRNNDRQQLRLKMAGGMFLPSSRN